MKFTFLVILIFKYRKIVIFWIYFALHNNTYELSIDYNFLGSTFLRFIKIIYFNSSYWIHLTDWARNVHFFLCSLLVEPMKRMMSSEYEYEDIGPPASFNQLPQPEGSWQENFQKKQAKYNTIMGASAAFLVGTLAFVCIKYDFIFRTARRCDLIVIFFNFASLGNIVRDHLLQCSRTRYIRISDSCYE